jgi:hypothetical protein
MKVEIARNKITSLKAPQTPVFLVIEFKKQLSAFNLYELHSIGTY